MKVFLIVLILLQVAIMSATIDFTSVYYSGVTADSMRSVRIRAIGPNPSVLAKNDGYVQTTAMQVIPDSFNDQIAAIHNPPYPYVGFRQDTDSTNVIIPVFHNSTTSPLINDLTPVAADAAGDAMFTDVNLDIVNTYVSSSADKFYFGIQNNGGGFPTSSGFIFYSYLAVIINPATVHDLNPVVWGLMYTIDIAGIISPGLYRITGQTTSDMARIGNIEVTIDNASNLLLLTCNKSDLLADPLFSAWYSNAHPELAGTFMTNKINLSEGVLIADQSFGYRLWDIQLPVPQANATAPTLSNASLQTGTDGMLHFEADYYSAEAYFPLTSEVVIDELQHYPMTYSSAPDWSSTMHYIAVIDPAVIGDWNSARLVFSSDNISYADTTFINTGIEDQFDNPEVSPLLMRVYPNPARDRIYIELSKNTADVKVELYNLKGQRLLSTYLEPLQKKLSLDLNEQLFPYSAGIYLLKVTSGKSLGTAKVIITK